MHSDAGSIPKPERDLFEFISTHTDKEGPPVSDSSSNACSFSIQSTQSAKVARMSATRRAESSVEKDAEKNFSSFCLGPCAFYLSPCF